MGRHRFVWLLLVTAALVAGCSADEDDPVEPSAAPRRTDPATSATTSTTEAPPTPPRALNTLDPPVAAAAVVEDAPDDGPGEEGVPLRDLQVGNCVDLPGLGADTPSETTAVLHPCDQAHDAEVFAQPSLDADPDAPHPGDDAVLAAADQTCLDAFAGYVGRPYVDTELEIVHLRPNEAAWVRGDRVVVCAVVSLDGEPLVEPVAGTP